MDTGLSSDNAVAVAFVPSHPSPHGVANLQASMRPTGAGGEGRRRARFRENGEGLGASSTASLFREFGSAGPIGRASPMEGSTPLAAGRAGQRPVRTIHASTRVDMGHEVPACVRTQCRHPSNESHVMPKSFVFFFSSSTCWSSRSASGHWLRIRDARRSSTSAALPTQSGSSLPPRRETAATWPSVGAAVVRRRRPGRQPLGPYPSGAFSTEDTWWSSGGGCVWPMPAPPQAAMPTKPRVPSAPPRRRTARRLVVLAQGPHRSKSQCAYI